MIIIGVAMIASSLASILLFKFCRYLCSKKKAKKYLAAPLPMDKDRSTLGLVDHPSLTLNESAGQRRLGVNFPDAVLHIGENQKSPPNAEGLKLPEHHKGLNKNQLLDEIVKHRAMLMEARMKADPQIDLAQVKDPKVLKQMVALKAKNTNLRNQVHLLEDNTDTSLEKSQKMILAKIREKAN
jgi:hypothetical protein